MNEYPEVSKATVAELLQKLDKEWQEWITSASSEDDLNALIVRNLDTYQLIQNSSTQEELNIINERYDWAYALFQTMNDLIDGKLAK